MMKYEEYANFLQQTETPHLIKSCPNSTIVRVENRNWFFPNGDPIENKYLKFIMTAKAEIIKNAMLLDIPDKKPKYFDFSKTYGEDRIYDAVELDIKGAYWHVFHVNGLICRETYLKGLEVPKEVRLMAGGAAATYRDVFEYKNGEYEMLEPEFNEYGRRAFFFAAWTVGNLMERISFNLLGGTFFYWVDAIFCRREYADYIVRTLWAEGYDCTWKDLWLVVCEGQPGRRPDVVTVYEKLPPEQHYCHKKTFKNPKKNLKKVIKVFEKPEKTG